MHIMLAGQTTERGTLCDLYKMCLLIKKIRRKMHVQTWMFFGFGRFSEIIVLKKSLYIYIYVHVCN